MGKIYYILSIYICIQFCVYKKSITLEGTIKKRYRSQESLTILVWGNIYLGAKFHQLIRKKKTSKKKVEGKISYANWHLCDKFKVSSRWEQGHLTEANNIRF